MCIVQLNSTIRLISGILCSTPLPWLPVLSNIKPPALQRMAVTDKLMEKIVKHDSWPIQPDTLSPPLLRLISRKPLWLDLQPVDIKSRRRHKWKSLEMEDLCHCGETQTMSNIVESCPDKTEWRLISVRSWPLMVHEMCTRRRRLHAVNADTCRCCQSDAVGPPFRKLWHFTCSKRRCLLMAGKDGEMFTTRSFNVTPKTTEQHLIAHTDKSVAYVT